MYYSLVRFTFQKLRTIEELTFQSCGLETRPSQPAAVSMSLPRAKFGLNCLNSKPKAILQASYELNV